MAIKTLDIETGDAVNRTLGTVKVLQILNRKRDQVRMLLRNLREAQNDEALALAKQSVFRAQLIKEVGEADAALILRTLEHFVEVSLGED